MQPQLLQKAVKGIDFLPRRLSGFQTVPKPLQGLPHPAAQIVDRIQPGLAPLVPGGAVAVGVVGPVHVPQPHPAVDLPLEDIVFQQVALLGRQSRQARFQPAEHILVLKAVLQGREHPGHQTPHRLFQHVAAAAEVHGDAVPGEHRLDDALVIPHGGGGHGDVPVAALPRRREAPDVRRCLLHLREGGVRLPDADGAAQVSPVRGQGPEKIPLQVAQGRVIPAGERDRLPGPPGPLGQAHQLLFGAQGGLEHLLAAVRLPQQGHSDAPGLPQQDLQHPPLLGGEVGEAVQVDILPHGVGGRLQVVAEFAHPVPGVQARPQEPGLVGGVQQAQVQELIPGGAALHLPGLGVQGGGIHLIAAQLIEQVQQLLQKGGLPGGAAVDPQLRRHLAQSLLQRQQLAAGVQRHLGAAGDGEHPLAQTAEAEDLGVAAGGIAAEAAQVHLRLVGGVLRHQQDLAAPVPLGADTLQDPVRFSRFGPAHENGQHSEPSLPSVLFRGYCSISGPALHPLFCPASKKGVRGGRGYGTMGKTRRAPPPERRTSHAHSPGTHRRSGAGAL